MVFVTISFCLKQLLYFGENDHFEWLIQLFSYWLNPPYIKLFKKG